MIAARMATMKRGTHGHPGRRLEPALSPRERGRAQARSVAEPGPGWTRGAEPHLHIRNTRTVGSAAAGQDAPELEENTLRLDLDSFEQLKERLGEIEAVEEGAVSAPEAPKRRGRPNGGDREAARHTGVSHTEVQRTRHVETAEEFPAMQGRAAAQRSRK